MKQNIYNKKQNLKKNTLNKMNMKKEYFDTIISDFEWLRYKEAFLPEDRAYVSTMYYKYLGKKICPGCGGLWEIKFSLMDFFCQIRSNYENGLIIFEDQEVKLEEAKLEEAKLEEAKLEDDAVSVKQETSIPETPGETTEETGEQEIIVKEKDSVVDVAIKTTKKYTSHRKKR